MPHGRGARYCRWCFDSRATREGGCEAVFGTSSRRAGDHNGLVARHAPPPVFSQRREQGVVRARSGPTAVSCGLPDRTGLVRATVSLRAPR